jgi:3-deoxy-7-phosphoheptulonate synthase / chorismate mutase
MSQPNEFAAQGAQTDMLESERIASLRSSLDQINLQLLDLIEVRGRLVHELMALKRSLGRPAYDPAREREMMNALLDNAHGVYPKAALQRIFAAIFIASRALGDNDL